MNSLKLALRGGKVERYHTIAGVRQNVAEHTFGVCQILHYITEGKCSKEALVCALNHDIAEYETGDIPHYAKRDNPYLKQITDEIEDKVLLDNKLLHTQTCISSEEKLLIKYADLCEMGLYALHLNFLGNGQGQFILDNVIKALYELIPFNNNRVDYLYKLFSDEYRATLPMKKTF